MPRKANRRENVERDSDIETLQNHASKQLDGYETADETSVKIGAGDAQITTENKSDVSPAVNSSNETVALNQVENGLPIVEINEGAESVSANGERGSQVPQDFISLPMFSTVIENAITKLGTVMQSAVNDMNTKIDQMVVVNEQQPLTQAIDQFVSSHPPPRRNRSNMVRELLLIEDISKGGLSMTISVPLMITLMGTILVSHLTGAHHADSVQPNFHLSLAKKHGGFGSTDSMRLLHVRVGQLGTSLMNCCLDFRGLLENLFSTS